MERVRSNTGLQVAIAGLIMLLLFVGSYWIVTSTSNEPLEKIDLDGTDSEIVSTNPQQTAALFIQANGTMGDIEKDITIESLSDNSAVFTNIDRRMNTLSEVEKALVPGSPIINENERKHIENFTRALNYPVLYKVENIKVGKPKNERDIQVRSKEGTSTYNALDLNVSFESIRSVFMAPNDTSYDGTHTQVDNKENFDVTIVLAKSGELWFVYDVLDSEYLVNERFSTWSGISNSIIDFEKDESVGYIQIPGIEPIDSTPLNNFEEEGKDD